MSFWDRLRQGLGELVEEIRDDFSLGEPARAALDRGGAALAAGELDVAEAAFLEATRLAPDHQRSWYWLGMTLLRREQLERAKAALERATALMPEDREAALALAQVCRRQGRNVEAIASAKRALQGRVDAPLLAQIYGLLGEAYLAQGEIDRAVRELRKAVAVTAGADLDLVGLLGVAHCRNGSWSLARQSLERAAVRNPADSAVLTHLAETLLQLDVVQQARLAALRLVEQQPDAIAGQQLLARCALAAGKPDEARDTLLRALESHPQDPESHRLLAEVYLAIDDAGSALRQLRISRSLQGSASSPALLRQIVELELEVGEIDALADDAQALLDQRADDAVGLAGAGLVARARPDHALELLSRGLSLEESYATRLAFGWFRLEEDRPREAAVALRAALRLRPAGQRARALLLEALSRAARPPSASDPSVAPAFYPMLRRLQHLFGQRGGLEDLLVSLAQVERDFDRPLLVAVMGEFNSGKSTFVNALIGEEVAPMGVTPTTATINVLKYGERRACRVIWRDDREELVPWEQVGPFLRQLGQQRACDVRVVELLYPAEELLRVNVVDTPGLNSMIAEHEAVAREYLQQADAVVWLFSADQAGKHTEQQALDAIHRQRLKTVAVVNKIDRLRAEQIDDVLAHLRDGFAEAVEAFAPVSARDALRALIANDTEALAASRFGELRELLEERFFSRSRRIKQQVCEQKLLAILGAARGRLERELAPLDATLAVLGDLTAQARQYEEEDPREQERTEVLRAVERVYREAAEEVLDFVRPRRWYFGTHRASAADRDFLVELLEQRLAHVGAQSFCRASAALRARSDALVAALRAQPSLGDSATEVERVAAQRTDMLQQQVYARFEAFCRGFLRGGRVDRFFEQQLPELSLEPEAAFRALAERGLDVEAELLRPLQDWHCETSAALRATLQRFSHEVAMAALEIDAGFLAPLGEIAPFADNDYQGAA